MTDLGDASQTLGIDISQNLPNDTLTLSQEKYTLSILNHDQMETYDPVHTSGNGARLTTNSKASRSARALRDGL